MSNEDYRQGYRDGFKDGQEAEKNKVNPYDMSKWRQAPLQVKETCPKCGIKISGVMGYVCYSPGCPTFPQVTCGPSVSTTMGAVGAMGQAISDAIGYNYQKEDASSGHVGYNKEYVRQHGEWYDGTWYPDRGR